MSEQSLSSPPADPSLTLAERARSSGLMHAVLAGIVAASTGYVQGHAWVGPAVLGGVIAIGLFRFGLSLWFVRLQRAFPVGSGHLFRGATLLAGAYWGVAAGAAVKSAFNLDALIVLLTTAGIAAGSTTSLSPDIRLVRTFLVLILGPLIVTCALVGTGQSTGVTLVCAMFLSFLLVQSGQLHREYVKTLEQARMLEQRARSLNEALERAERSQAVADAASRAKSEFLANMSHELRTPMTSVIGYSEQLLGADVPPHDRIAYAEIIRRNGEHLLELINDILDLSKIEAGKMTVQAGPCSMPTVLAEVKSLMQPRATAKNLSFTTALETPIPATITSDALRVRQIILNLVGNALKFTETGMVEVRARFDEAGRDGPRLRISVKDTGIGLTQEQMDRLFEPFVQVDASANRRFQGTGLGLCISQRFARMLGGQVSVKSALGIGSVFTLDIPTGPVDAELCNSLTLSLEHKQLENQATQTLDGISILLAEDSSDNERLLSAILQRAGAYVEVARDGQKALEMARARVYEGAPFDVVLMDMQMPVLDGYGATAQLRAQGYRHPIIALTANAMSGDRERCIAAGCDDHIAKPVRRSRLLELVGRHARAPRELEHTHVFASGSLPRASAEVRIAREPELATSDDDAPIWSTLADDPIVGELMGEFLEDLQKKLLHIEQLCASELDMHGLMQLGHAMAGTGGSYGFDALTVCARSLQDAAHVGDEELTRKHATELMKLCRRVLLTKPTVCGQAVVRQSAAQS